MGKKIEHGFTLIEVLVSLLIFSTASIGLMQAGRQNTQAIYRAEQKQIAGIIADNQLLLALHTKNNLGVGTQNAKVEMSGRVWHWHIRTEKTTQTGFYRLTVSIREGNSEHIVLTRTAYAQGPS